MKIWFDPTEGNPNDAVFKSKMNFMTSSEVQSAESDSMSLTGLCTIIFILMFVIMTVVFLGYVKIRERYRRGSLLC